MRTNIFTAMPWEISWRHVLLEGDAAQANDRCPRRQMISHSANCILHTANSLHFAIGYFTYCNIAYSIYAHSSYLSQMHIFGNLCTYIYTQCTMHTAQFAMHNILCTPSILCTMHNVQSHCSWYMDGKTSAWVPIQILSWNKWYTPWIDSQHNPTFSIPFNFIWDRTNHEVK